MVEREARDVTISSLTMRPGRLPSDYLLSVTCSGGTYIRTLCADIGQALGCGGVMATLRRTMACGFTLSQCYTLEALAEMSPEERCACLLPVEMLFENHPVVKPAPFYFHLCKNGCELYQKRIGTSFDMGTRVRMYTPDGEFFALGEVQDFEEGSAIKVIKIFVLP